MLHKKNILIFCAVIFSAVIVSASEPSVNKKCHALTNMSCCKKICEVKIENLSLKSSVIELDSSNIDLDIILD